MRPLRIVGWSALAVVSLFALAIIAGYFTLRASLPQLDGNIAVSELKAPATIARDALGTPTIRAASRRDLAQFERTGSMIVR